jgi:hypothetical protein
MLRFIAGRKEVSNDSRRPALEFDIHGSLLCPRSMGQRYTEMRLR